VIIAAACAFITVALFSVYKIALGSDVNAVQVLSLRGLR
jgi:hypothetical protein